jgi:hypothetical protein
MRRRVIALGAAVAGILGPATPACATIPVHAIGRNAEDAPMPAVSKHPGGPGHLPAGSENVDLVGKVGLTHVDGGICRRRRVRRLLVSERVQARVSLEPRCGDRDAGRRHP